MKHCIVEKLARRLERRAGGEETAGWAVLGHCLAATQAAGELLLQLEAAQTEMAAQFLVSTRTFLGPDSGDAPALEQHHTFLLDPAADRALVELRAAVEAGGPLLQDCITAVATVCSELGRATWAVLFRPVSSQLELVPGLEVWQAPAPPGTQDMPDFSFSPTECVTLLGEHLMTVPQHLEPYMGRDSPALLRALQLAVLPGSPALQHGLASTYFHQAQSPADFLLGCLSAAACSAFLTALAGIPSLAAPDRGAKQLATDISYLGEVLGDLGHPLAGDLAGAGELLRLPRDQWGLPTTSHHPSKLVNMVNKLRKIQE